MLQNIMQNLSHKHWKLYCVRFCLIFSLRRYIHSNLLYLYTVLGLYIRVLYKYSQSVSEMFMLFDNNWYFLSYGC